MSDDTKRHDAPRKGAPEEETAEDGAAQARTANSATLRRLSQQDFASLGLNDLAYVRPVRVDGDAGFAVYAADGTPLMVAGAEQAAWEAIQEHDMTPVHVH